MNRSGKPAIEEEEDEDEDEDEEDEELVASERFCLLDGDNFMLEEHDRGEEVGWF